MSKKSSAKPRLKLTPAAIAKVRYPEKGAKRVQISDAETPSLKLRLTHASKSLSFLYRSPLDGRARRVHLATWIDGASSDVQRTELAKVRREVADLRLRVSRGECPATEKGDARAAQRAEKEAHRAARAAATNAEEAANGDAVAPSMLTLSRVVDLHLEDREVAARKNTSAKAGSLAWHWLGGDPDARDLSDIPIRGLTDDMIEERLEQLANDGRMGARSEALKHLKAVLAWATKRKVDGERILVENPATLVSIAKSKSRSRYLDADEVGAFWLATERIAAPWKQILRVLLATGCRRSEIERATLDELKNEGGTPILYISGTRRKVDDDLVVPIPTVVRPEIEEMRGLAGNGPFLFSCNAGDTFARGVRRPYDDVVKPKMAELLDVERSLYKNDGSKHVTIHDLRRTFRRHLTRIGTPPHIAEQLVGHRPPAIVRIYDPSDPWAWFAEKLEAVEAWGDEIDRLASEIKARQ